MDCLRAVLAAIYDDQRETDKIYAHIMEEIESCAPHSNLESVAADMLKKGRRRRPVVSGGGLIGQVTCRQTLSAISHRGWEEMAL
jgi:predicted transcriptional regulator